MIELQTSKNKSSLKDFDESVQGLVHFCLYTNNINKALEKLIDSKKCIFKEKNGKRLYSVGKSKLIKIIAPEGTIIEIRDSLNP